MLGLQTLQPLTACAMQAINYVESSKVILESGTRNPNALPSALYGCPYPSTANGDCKPPASCNCYQVLLLINNCDARCPSASLFHSFCVQASSPSNPCVLILLACFTRREHAMDHARPMLVVRSTAYSLARNCLGSNLSPKTSSVHPEVLCLGASQGIPFN